jgi:magnesium transporter
MSNCIQTVKFDQFDWIDICNPQEEELLGIAKSYSLGYLQIRDCLQTGHLPKLEKTEHHEFLLLRAFSAELTDRITNINELSNKVAFFYNDKQVITIHRAKFTFLKKPELRIQETEQLVIHFVSEMIKSFSGPSLYLSEQVDQLEHVIFIKGFNKISLESLYYHKSQTRISKKLLHITQNVLLQWEVKSEHKAALNDVKDLLQNLILTYDEVTDDSINLMNTYLSVSAQKNNDVMKLLTIFSAFFLPLTFIVGIYGMNFENMPELRHQNGYFITLGAMAILIIVIFIWFRKKKIM